MTGHRCGSESITPDSDRKAISVSPPTHKRLSPQRDSPGDSWVKLEIPAGLLHSAGCAKVSLPAQETRGYRRNDDEKDLRWTGSFLAFVGLLVCLFFPHRAAAQQFSAWSAPVNLNALTLSDGTPCPAVVNSASVDNHPTISKDGLSLIFQSNRPGGSGGVDLWVTERDSLDDCWLPPFNLGPIVNSAFGDFAPNLTTDGHWLYFSSNRPTSLTADGIAVPSCGGGDLYFSHRQDKRNDRGWEAPVKLDCTINTPGFDQAGPTSFEDDATGIHFLYFTSRSIGASDVLFDI